MWNKVKTPAADDSKKASQPADAPGINSIWNKRPKATADSGDTSPAPEAAESKSKALSNAPAKPAPASLRKSGSSGGGIMQAFAKGASAAKPKKKEPAPPAKPKPEDEDTSMALSDDGGGGDDDDMDVIPKAQQVASGQSRKERQEALRKMMEDDEEAEDEEAEDEEDEDKNADDEREDTPMEDAAEAPVEAVGPPVKNEGPSEVVTTSAGDGRRRGRRRVMRKKTVEDENGYLGMRSLSLLYAPELPANLARNRPGARVGVILRGRGATAGQGSSISHDCAQAQETSAQDRPGQHHVLLCEEMRGLEVAMVAV